MLLQHWKMRTKILYLGGNCFSMAVRKKTACQPGPRGLLSICFRLDFLRLGFFFSFLDPMTCCCFYVLQGRQQSTSGFFNDMISHHTKPPPLWPPTETCWLHLSIRCRCICVCARVRACVRLSDCVCLWLTACMCVFKVQRGQHTASDGSSMPRGQLLLRMPRKESEREKDKEEH